MKETLYRSSKGLSNSSTLTLMFFFALLIQILSLANITAESWKQFLFLAIFMLLAAILSTSTPDIKVTETGLLVEFFLGWIELKWDDIISIKESDQVFWTIWIVRANHLTPLHRFNGLQLFRFYPCFEITPQMKGCHKLVGEIKQHIHQRKLISDIHHPEEIKDQYS